MTDCEAKKIASYLGLAQRAGAVLYGEDIIVERLVKAKVVLVDACASEKYKDRLSRRIGDCPIYTVVGLRQALHKEAVNAVSVTNAEFAKVIIDLLR